MKAVARAVRLGAGGVKRAKPGRWDEPLLAIRHDLGRLRKLDGWVARIRLLYWAWARLYEYEQCLRCGRPYFLQIGDTYWHASNDLWNAVEGGPGGLRCPRCFTQDCQERGVSIYWRAAPLRARAFAGEREAEMPAGAQMSAPKGIQQCDWFGHRGELTLDQLDSCGCTRCLSETREKQATKDLLRDYERTQGQ